MTYPNVGVAKKLAKCKITEHTMTPPKSQIRKDWVGRVQCAWNRSHINQAWWYIPITPSLFGTWERGSQEFKVSLSYLRLCLKKTLMQNESLMLIPAALCTFTADLFLNIKHAYFRSCGLIFSKAYG